MLPEVWTVSRLALVALGVLLLGMHKGGFPVGSITLPLLILVWPEGDRPAKQVVAFMLPLLCAMDVVAILFYRRHILWQRIWPLLPGTIAGVIFASLLFVSDSSALALSDRWLKIGVGVIGILFVIYQGARHRIAAGLGEKREPSLMAKASLGAAAGVTSTIAHAAGPVAQMYFQPQRLEKMNFAATLIGFFWLLNLIKLVPFGMMGRLHVQNLSLAAMMAPLIPLGVGCGYLLVRRMKSQAYLRFIYAMLLVTSLILIVKALA